MKAADFDIVVDECCDLIKKVLGNKAKEYASKSHDKDGDDRLYNFKRAGQIIGCTPKEALAGIMSKHLVSVMDLIHGKLENTEYMRNEKIGDTINYLILLKGMLIEEEQQSIKVELSNENEIRGAQMIAESRIPDDVPISTTIKTEPQINAERQVYNIKTTGGASGGSVTISPVVPPNYGHKKKKNDDQIDAQPIFQPV